MPQQPASIGFLPAHPSQVWLFHAIAKSLDSDISVHWYIRDKDVSTELADALGIDYQIISTAQSGYLGNAIELAVTTLKLLFLRRSPDLWVSKYGAANVAARLRGLRSISFNDDDIDIVPLIAYTSYPFANLILAPTKTRMGSFDRKTVRYRSPNELFYLHPNRFVADPEIVREVGIDPAHPFVFIRLSAFQAHHDAKRGGITTEFARKLVERLRPNYQILISSEGQLLPEFKTYQLSIPAHLVHHVLFHADMFIGDSQTMCLEAGVLGTPAFRINDFVGEIGILEWLDSEGVCFGFLPTNSDDCLSTIEKMSSDTSYLSKHRSHCEGFVRQCDDPLPTFVEAIHALLRKEPTSDIRARLTRVQDTSVN